MPFCSAPELEWCALHKPGDGLDGRGRQSLRSERRQHQAQEAGYTGLSKTQQVWADCADHSCRRVSGVGRRLNGSSRKHISGSRRSRLRPFSKRTST